jgi:hypothetical protein
VCLLLYCTVDIWTQVDPSTQQGSATFFKYLSLLHPVSFYTYVWTCKNVLMIINRKCKGGRKARIFFYSLKRLKVYTMQMSIKNRCVLKSILQIDSAAVDCTTVMRFSCFPCHSKFGSLFKQCDIFNKDDEQESSAATQINFALVCFFVCSWVRLGG